jgi:hypothetical protein
MATPLTPQLSVLYQGVCYSADDITAWPWPEREMLGLGGFAVVYQLHGLAAKVGQIAPDEVAAQRHFAHVGLMLPVLLYQPQVTLPSDVSLEVCPRHGLRREFLPDGQFCTCRHQQDILLMPVAEPLTETEDTQLYTRAFIAGFARDCERELDRLWDTRPSNVARYQGRMIALDMGHPFL